ncbi:chromosome partitioning protein ParB [Desulfobacter hydrogenophilus]|uniref:Chromosome partitioning protein ParB n=1 Tax=Desulfobacter hydrogenophilus TaxID=2291 RepID=A0A328FA19_9BACT|nr:ParB/RepB/Spo0J family partition protein [Desulfobacter hydrogenophilus]NDY72155.1 ParB/RepB/Spo0J family partition protein [Desulfobacter hydrogenophilus]QBH14880.1 ParB/RepB/Spo0J family partition protein [Desulfobacter hydrogenophilus]RAM01388.1 chromosome partitioning protein ParB [Desulfobacter hydrogenophilus]
MMNKKRKNTGLGRGISALIPDMEEPEVNSDFFFCNVDQLSPNRYQPRTRFSEEELERLTQSIAEQGVLQPLLARKMDGAYELIAGERRLRSAKAAGLSQVPVIILDLTDEQVLEVSIIENIQRENLNVLEEAEAYFRLIDEFGYTQEKVAEKIGKNRSTIANLLRLRSLPEEIKESLIAETISMGHARALLGAGSVENQLYLFKQVVEHHLSVRETERLVNQAKKQPQKIEKKMTADEKQFLEETSSQISSRINSPVFIKKSGGRGRIEIKFSSGSEFNRLVELLSRIS